MSVIYHQQLDGKSKFIRKLCNLNITIFGFINGFPMNWVFVGVLVSVIGLKSGLAGNGPI